MTGPITRVTGISELGFHGIAHRTELALPSMLSPFEAYLLSLMDGVSSVDDVVAASGLSTANAALSLQRLLQLGLVRFSHGPEAARPPEPAQPPAARPAPVVEVDLEGALADARQCVTGRQFAVARGRLTGILASVPGHVEAQQLLAQLNDPAQARTRAEQLVALADSAERDARVAEAARLLQEAVAECPTLASARFSLAVLTLRTQGASPDVVEHLRCAQELEPDNAIYATMYQRVRGFVDRAPPGGRS